MCSVTLMTPTMFTEDLCFQKMATVNNNNSQHYSKATQNRLFAPETFLKTYKIEHE